MRGHWIVTIVREDDGKIVIVDDETRMRIEGDTLAEAMEKLTIIAGYWVEAIERMEKMT